ATVDADITLLTGFGGEVPFVDEMLAHFQPRYERARDFALRNRVLLLWSSLFSAAALAFLVASVVLNLTPRFLAIHRFRQSFLGAILHPLGITLLLVIQWWALFRKLCGASETWKGRSLVKSSASLAQ
ncbi:MAG: hypothetical protein ACK4UN_15870, partial [Limisphaerales bacterium]